MLCPIFIPIGHDKTVRRWPIVTITLMVICTLVQIYTAGFAPSEREIDAVAVAQLEAEDRLLEKHSPEREGLRPDRGYTPAQKEFLTAVREGKVLSSDTPEVRELRAADEQLERVLRRHPVFSMGYAPKMGLSIRMLLSAFIHAGWLHLIGNLLYLWLAGAALEDRWGRPAFLVFYGLGAVAASGAYALWHPGSSTPAVGASGAIAACMGAFLVCFAATTIRFWYLWIVFIKIFRGTFEMKAYWALPLWFVTQAFYSLFERGTGGGVGYSAHAGGFAFGAVVALALRMSGIEEKHLLPPVDVQSQWTEDPDFEKALDARTQGRPAEAIGLLEKVLANNPHHPTAEKELLMMALDSKDRGQIERRASSVLLTISRRAAAEDVIDLYLLVEKLAPEAPLSDRALAQVVQKAVSLANAPIALRAAGRVLRDHPQSDLVPSILWRMAEVRELERRPDLAEKTLRNLVDQFPDSPFAHQARTKLAPKQPAMK